MLLPRPRRSLSPRAPLRVGLSLVAAVLAFAISRCEAGLPQEAVVRRVVDGDTVELTDGRLVRYIGIDTPEVRRREDHRWVVHPEPFGVEAMDANKRLVQGKRVRFEYDIETHDRYGRILAYVYVDGRMVNAQLVEDGDARVLTIPPDVKYADRFRRLADDARRAHRGVWADAASPTRGGAPHGQDLRGR